MGIKHLKWIEEILKQSGLPMMKLEIASKFEELAGCQLNHRILTETLTHLIDEKKVKIIKIIGQRKWYKWIQ